VTFNAADIAHRGLVEVPGQSVAADVIRSAEGGLIVGEAEGVTDDISRFVIARYTADGAFLGRAATNFASGSDDTVRALAKGPGRRFVATGGHSTARYLDEGANVVHATTFLDPNGAEAGRDPASFFVFREERLPFATRVFFSVGGTALSSNPLGLPDYTVTGMSLTSSRTATTTTFFTPFVDIPANETFAQVTLTPVDDTVVEAKETAVFTILGSSNYEIGAPSAATLTIADNDFAFVTSRVGTSKLTPAAAVVPPSGQITYEVEWTHPGVWRDLDTIEFRIVNDFGVLGWVRWEESTNLFTLYDVETGAYSESGLPGSNKKLRAGDLELDLRNTKAVGTGPTGPSVTLTLALKLKKRHRGDGPVDYRVELFASDDDGDKQGFEVAGTLRF
jgi:hypothetical protein